MIIGEQIIIKPNFPIKQKSAIVEYWERCEKVYPKPLFCELPEDLKLKASLNNGTGPTSTYTTTSSGPSVSGTSTTTTL